MKKHRVQAILAAVGKRARIGARLSPHKLRHTFATMSLRNGATLEHVKLMLGHADVSTTSRNYSHLTNVDLAKRARTSSPVTNLGFTKGRAVQSRSTKGGERPPAGIHDDQPQPGEGGNTYVTIHNQPPRETSSDRRVNQHYDDLAKVARVVYDVQQFIQGYGERQRFIVTESPNPPGFFTFQPLPQEEPESDFIVNGSVSLDHPEVIYFFQHLLEMFSDLKLKDWRELVTSRTPLPKTGY